ncbi:DUF819 family protein [Longirhabdus pacifica]|uniref:DUF819 family protein n=1 Tax=Longirhabdus pacifica TaxID=2305227 RepID=UPI0013E8E3D7|nr:DUF819 family protein [Longirhabdus pacifica]
MPTMFLFIYFLMMPAIIIWACIQFSAIRKIGIVLLCYFAGLFIGNVFDLSHIPPADLETFSGIMIMIALPLLLFSLNIRSWFSELAGKALLSMILAITSVTIIVGVLTFFYSERYAEEAYQLAGLSVGVYTGGTPNLASIQAALDVNSDLFAVFLAYDTVLSLLFIVFVLTIGRSVFQLILPRFKQQNESANNNGDIAEIEDITLYKDLIKPSYLKYLLGALLLSIILFAISFGISSFFASSMQTAVIILCITTFGVAISLIDRVRQIPRTFSFGMYFIYIFCIIIGSMTRLENLSFVNGDIFIYVGTAIFGSMLLHALFCKIFSIDTDTFLVTSTAAICSPPFIPLVAASIKNPSVILSGLSMGILGYIAGNYLGISIGLLFRSWI